jgi:hypothetical protein
MTAHAMPAQFIPSSCSGVALTAFQALLEHSDAAGTLRQALLNALPLR